MPDPVARWYLPPLRQGPVAGRAAFRPGHRRLRRGAEQILARRASAPARVLGLANRADHPPLTITREV
jgi:hypothetical protein